MSQTLPTPSRAALRRRFAWRPAGTAAVAALGALAAWTVAGVAGGLAWAIAATLVAGWTTGSLPRGQTAASRTGNDDDDDVLRLQRQVVPVWRRNVTAARAHAEDSMQQLVESFAGVMEHLEHAVGTPVVKMGADDQDALLERHHAELERLLSTTRLVVGMKDRLYDGVASLDDTLQEMSTLAREVQRISRATHLLALNASVEATRASHSGEGFAVVAQEVRRLAGDARRAGMRLGDHVDAMQKRLRDLKKDVRRHDTEDEEIVLQAEENARAVLRALLGSTAEASRAAAALQQGSRAVQDDLERILMNLQSQDRLSQMLNAVTDDMGRLHDWLAGTDDPVARVPARWLERLEQSYTMEEQRSSHHDTVVIDKQAAVEFF